MLSNRLAELRLRAGLSAAELGRLAGLSRATVAAIESGTRPDPVASTVVALAQVLGGRVSYLLNGEGLPPSDRRLRAAVRAARRRAAGREDPSGA